MKNINTYFDRNQSKPSENTIESFPKSIRRLHHPNRKLFYMIKTSTTYKIMNGKNENNEGKDYKFFNLNIIGSKDFKIIIL